MKRDARLVALSRDHYRALVLAAALRRGGNPTQLRARVAHEFETDLEPHVRMEEAYLLAPLDRHDDAAPLVARGRADHAFLRAGAAAMRAGAAPDSATWGRRLHDHVRFEERELFPLCERLLTDAELDALAARMAAADDGPAVG